MPRVVGPLLSEEATGALAGIMYRRGTYGQIVSRRSLSPNRQSRVQQIQQGLLKRAHTSYDTLTTAQKAAWALHAAAHETSRNAYIRAYTKLLRAGITPLTLPAPVDPAAEIHDVTLTYDPDVSPYVHVSWSYTGDPTAEIFYYVYSSYGHRSDEKSHKHIIATHNALNYGPRYLTTVPIRPTIYIRFEVVSRNSGKTLMKVEKRIKT